MMSWVFCPPALLGGRAPCPLYGSIQWFQLPEVLPLALPLMDLVTMTWMLWLKFIAVGVILEHSVGAPEPTLFRAW